MQLLACIVILVISSIFLGLWHGFYTLATYILPPILSFLLTAFAFYHLILDMCRRFTFPGSTWLWRRNIENHYQKAFVIKTRKKLILLKSLVLYIGEGNNIWKDLIPNYERKEIAKTLALVLNLYGKQAMHNTLTKRQKVMMNQFNDIDNALRLTKLNGKASGKSISFWEFLEDAKRDMEHLEPHLNFVFEDENMGTHLLEKCKALEARLHDIICEKGCFANMKRFLFENSFGTIDHMREELDNKYKCQRISLKVSGNNTIDCLLVSKKVEHEEESSVLPSKDPQAIEMTHLNRRDISSKLTQATSIKNKTVGPTMILCCPNAGYYEYMCYESQWIDIYIKHGFNVLLWNYRGYGRSTGKPDPQAMRSDGEAIVDYLRENMGVEVIGCHGESIGGLVATHIARWKDIDFLCADRSFESLFTIGRLVVGKGMCSFYRILTGWDDRLTLDFLETKCYKVITFDPKDEVIPFICSLRHGISKRISQERLGFYTGEPIRPVQKGEHWIISPRAWILRCKKLIHSIRTEIFLNKLEKQSKKDYGILKKMHMNAFYNAFTRIFDLFECYSALRNHMNIKKHRRIISAGGLPQLSTPMKLLPPAHAGDQGNASPESVKEGPDENLSPSNVSIIAGNRDRHECGTHSELGIERISNHSNQSQGYPEYDIDYSASLEKEPYEKLFDDEAQKDPDFIVFLESIFTSFELFELGGVQIENIMMVPLLERFDAFKHFLNSLWIWGAYLPLHQTVKEGATDISYHQEKAIKKIKILIRRLDNTARTERLKEQANAVPSPYKNLKNAILDDLELIISILPMLTNNATKMWEEERERGKTATNQIELIPRKTRDALTAPLLDLQVDVEKEYKRDYGSTVGHLIPLCCGHNGNLRPLEVEMYEYYLKNAGLT